MSTQTPDVNDAFAAERADQVARAERNSIPARVERGELRPLGGDLYRVETGWDAGETLKLVDGQLIPQHGLDMSTGQAALYSTVPAWHGLGQVVPGGTTLVSEVLDLAQIGWDVALRPVEFTWRGNRAEVDGSFVTVRTDTYAPLGVVGRHYHPIQNSEAFSFLQDLAEKYDVTWESAGALRGGCRVFISMRLPQELRVDREGINDEIIPFIAAMNSHDGTSAFSVVVTPWRPVCANTERFAVRDAHSRWSVRHTASATTRVAEARRTLGLSMRYYERFAAEETELAQMEMSNAEVDKLIGELWPVATDPTTRQAKAAARRHGAVREVWAVERERVGATAYAAERAITGYLDHGLNTKPSPTMGLTTLRGMRALEGAYDDVKTRAHQKLMLLRRR